MVQDSIDTITLRGYIGMLDPGDYHFLRLVVDGVLTKKSICHTNLTRYGNRVIRHIDIAASMTNCTISNCRFYTFTFSY